MLAIRTGSRLAVLCCKKQRSFIDFTHRCEPKLDNDMISWMRDTKLRWLRCGSTCTGCRGKHTRSTVTTSWEVTAARHRSRALARCSNTITPGRFPNFKQGSMVLWDSCRVGRLERMYSILREVRSSALGRKDSGQMDQVEPVGDSLEIEILCAYEGIK